MQSNLLCPDRTQKRSNENATRTLICHSHVGLPYIIYYSLLLQRVHKIGLNDWFHEPACVTLTRRTHDRPVTNPPPSRPLLSVGVVFFAEDRLVLSVKVVKSTEIY